MIVLKYFHEEPASLEVLSEDDDPDARRQSADLSLEDFLRQKQYFRGYLTATNLADRTFGLTTLPASAFADLLQDILDGRSACVYFQTGVETALIAPEVHMRANELQAIVAGKGSFDGLVEGVSGLGDRRRSLSSLRSMLDAGYMVMFPEPAHDGTDLSLFSARSLRPAVEAGMRHLTGANLRAFSIPHREARSEEKFYFERYDLERYRVYEVTND